jgi:hypothetical protein
MATEVVRTKEDFEKVKQQMPEVIIFEGEMAEKMRKAIKAKKIGKAVGIGGGALAVLGVIGGIVAAPVTAGLSLGATAAGIAGLTATTVGGTIALSTVEVAIVAGVIVSALGVSLAVVKDLLKHYDIEIPTANGSLKFTRKQETR